MTGFFELKTANDLRQKLNREFNRLKDDQTNVDIAFNFFVTAEHMLDWLYPCNETARKNERQKSDYLLICWHIATGAKHFNIVNKSLKSINAVSSTDKVATGQFGMKQFGMKQFSSNQFLRNERLIITLDGDIASRLGRDNIEAIELAKNALEYWNKAKL